jgi:hypothetical protein
MKELEKVKDLWVRLGLREPSFPAKDLICNGCQPENKCAYPEIRTCAYEKGVSSCGLCENYPCQRIKEVFGRTEIWKTKSLANCSSEEYELINKAFGLKKKYLDEIHRENQKKESRIHR